MQRFTGFLKRWSELLLVFVLLFCGCSVRPATAAAAGAATVAAAATAAGAERKNYGIEYHRYVLDFEDAGALENSEGWKFSNAGQATAADGSLTVQGNGFAIRSAEILGDAYGAEDTQLTFDMTLTDGQVSVGVRLKSTVSANDTGIWFTIGPDTVAVRAGGTALSGVVAHHLSLDTKRTYTIRNGYNWIRLSVTEGASDKQIAAVRYESGGTICVYDGDGAAVSEAVPNVRTPQVGFWKMQFEDFVGSVEQVVYYSNEVTQNPVAPDPGRTVDYGTWVAADDLGRVTPMQTEVGGPRADRYVGLFYFLWHTEDRDMHVTDYTKIYLEDGLSGLKAYLEGQSTGYWSEPYFGYYTSKDPWVYRKHAYMLSAAGVDFIFLDMSNGVAYPEQLEVLLDTWLQMRREGSDTPQIVCHMGNDAYILVRDLYAIWDRYLSQERYGELWFQWEGKPLLFGNTEWDPAAPERTVGQLSAEERAFYESGRMQEILDSHFTVRRSWAWQASRYEQDRGYAGYWDWLDDWPQSPGRDFNGKPEQMSVSCAQHVHTNRGRSWVNGNTEYGTGLEDFDFTLETSRLGLCFAQQFEHAIEADPRVIMITGWNEWIATRQQIDDPNMRMAHTATPNYYFVDTFNPEFSRDLEPMRLRDGVGFGDNYYYQMVQYIRRFKGLDPLPKTEGRKTVTLDTDAGALLAQWDDVGPAYRDTVGDTVYRNHTSAGNEYQYVNSTGRNDLDYAKVTEDADSLYFLITTAGVLTDADGETWMNLYINADQDYGTGWEGYEYVINRSRDGKTMSVERFADGTWAFEPAGTAEYARGTDFLAVKVAKETVALSGETVAFDFKWADNSTDCGDSMQFMELGDCAPNDRFNFRYSSVQTAPARTAVAVWKWVLIAGIAAAVLGAGVWFVLYINRSLKGCMKMNRKILLMLSIALAVMTVCGCASGTTKAPESSGTGTALPGETAGTPTAGAPTDGAPTAGAPTDSEPTDSVPTDGTPTETPVPPDGKPNAQSEMLFSDDFDSQTVDEMKDGVAYAVTQPEYISFSEGRMRILTDWSAFKPLWVDHLTASYRQYEFSIDYYSDVEFTVAHKGMFIGCRVPSEYIPVYSGGFWVAFYGADHVSVYPGGNNFPDVGSWDGRYFTVDIPESFLNKPHTITVVDTTDAIYYYMNTEAEELYLIVKAVIDDTDLLCYGHDGELIWEGECGLNDTVDFSVFSHFTNSYLDNLTVKGLR